jgi:hypothetical protein
MARLDKRSRLALKELKRIDGEIRQRANAVEGQRSLTRGNFDNLIPSGKSRPQWGWDWKAARRIKNNGAWV